VGKDSGDHQPICHEGAEDCRGGTHPDAQDGNKRYVTEVVVNSMEFCESRRDTGSSAGYADEYPGAVVLDSDIPF